MAVYSPLKSSVVLRLNTGTGGDGKMIVRSVTMSRIRPAVDATSLKSATIPARPSVQDFAVSLNTNPPGLRQFIASPALKIMRLTIAPRDSRTEASAAPNDPKGAETIRKRRPNRPCFASPR